MTTLRLSTSVVSSLFAAVLATSGCVDFITGNDSSDEVGDGDGDTTGDGDSGDGDPGDGDPSGSATIYQIQQGEIGEGMIVTVNGVVVTTPVKAEAGLVFVQEPTAGPYSGISLYMWSEVVMSTPLKPGDVVNLTGEYAEFHGMSQIIVRNPDDISIVGSATVPGPDMVTTAEIARDNPATEPWEGVRVRVVDAVIAAPNDGYGQYLLTGDALVGNAFVDPLPQVHVGGSYGSITGPIHYSYDEYKLQVASQADLVGYQGPSDPTDGTSIYDIQQGAVPEGTGVIIEGVIASSGFTWSNTQSASFFVQEPEGGPFSGIQVFVQDKTGMAIAAGDELTVAGTYVEYFGMSQITVPDSSGVTKLGSGPAPTPEVIADPASIATGGALAQDYQGVLVRVQNVTVIDDNPDAPMDFGEFVVTGNLRVDDMFFAFADWNKPAIGTQYASITGPLVYSFSNFKLEPRNAGDLVAN
jgi:DNA/RNA endonuclease YhcR with UshA esterase domain